MSRRAISTLAYVIHELRPDWDRPGIEAALERAHQTNPDLAAITHAAIAATNRDDQHTPAIIALPGPHWTCTSSQTSPLPPKPRCLEEPMGEPIPAETRAHHLARIRNARSHT